MKRQPGERRNVQDVTLVVRLSATLRGAAQAAAEARGMSLSEWVRALIAEATAGPILAPMRREPKGGKGM
jgi:predicted HicB family RNase H-like nuclease